MAEEILKTQCNRAPIKHIGEFIKANQKEKEDIIDTTFTYVQGISTTFLTDFLELEAKLKQQMQKSNLLYQRIDGLKPISNPEDISYYVNSYQAYQDGKGISLKTLQNSQRFEKTLEYAIQKICNVYFCDAIGNKESLQKNFVVKLFYWLDQYASKLISCWENYPVKKIIAVNVLKEQEYLFFYLLTLLGCDVMLLAVEQEIKLKDTLSGLSNQLFLGPYKKVEIPVFSYHCEAEQIARVEGFNSNETSEKRIVVHIPERNRRSNMKDGGKNSNSDSRQRQEKSYEQLASFADSIVMIEEYDSNGNINGTGSGIMVGKEGYILTNFHVIEGGSYFGVIIENDDTTYHTDEVIKYNEALDLALIRINRHLTPIRVYDGKDVIVRGQKVVAIGSPLGFFNTVSDGIVSGIRQLKHKNAVVHMIQHTAPIAPGSSGGAILNLYGEVIGITTLHFVEGQNMNMAVSYEEINPFIRGFV